MSYLILCYGICQQANIALCRNAASAIAHLVGCMPECNSCYSTDEFLVTHILMLEASDRSLTTPMKVDRRELSVEIQRFSAAGDG
jgi:hypothetical protein